MENDSERGVLFESSRGKGSLGLFLVSQFIVLSGLDFFLRLALADPDFGVREVAFECFLGTMSQLAVISPVLVLLGVVFYCLRSRPRVLMVLVPVIDLVYVLAGFGAHVYYLFFHRFPSPSAIFDLTSMEVVATAATYILPRPETVAFVSAPMALFFLSALFSIRRRGEEWSKLGFGALAVAILVAGFAPYAVLSGAGMKAPQYIHLHPLTSVNISLNLTPLEGREIPEEFVKSLRRQACCPEGRFSPEYPLYKLSRRQTPFPEVLKNGPPNLVMVMVESFAAVNLGAYGGRYGLTPNFDALAREGIFFTGVRSTVFSTTAAEINVLCSQSVRHDYYREVLKHKLPGLPYFLKQNGYKSVAWFHNGEKRFERQDEILKRFGFDEIYDFSDMPRDCPRGPWGCSDKSLMKFAVDKMEEMDEPFMAFIMTVNNHPPFSPFPEDGRPVEIDSPGLSPRRKKSLRMVHYSDEALGRLMELSGKRPFFENTVFVITADHEIREDEIKPPLSRPSDVLDRAKIPLVIWSPLLKNGGEIETDGYQADIAPTILELLGISTRDSFIGAGLFGEDNCRRVGVTGDFIAAGDHAVVIKPGFPVYRLSDYSPVEGGAADRIFRQIARDFTAREVYYPVLVREGRLYPP